MPQQPCLPKHGGDIAWASATFAIPEGDWLDLSTGISPWSWPVEHWPQQVFRRLPPQSHSELQRVAGTYYGCPSHGLLPVPGSQYAITLIPKLLSPETVAIPEMGYQEHAQAWLDAGHQVLYYRTLDELWGWVEEARIEHLVLINPNNPSAHYMAPNTLVELHKLLMQKTTRRGLMVIDEAFMDAQPSHSMAGMALSNLLVLRSFGKFFGLAGVRLGFVIDHSGHWIARLKQQAGPWLISHPAIWVALQALQDEGWVTQQRERINVFSGELVQLLNAYFQPLSWASECANGGLFVTTTGDPEPLYQLFAHLAAQGILVRFGELDADRGWLRFGLCEDMTRLKLALNRPLEPNILVAWENG